MLLTILFNSDWNFVEYGINMFDISVDDTDITIAQFTTELFEELNIYFKSKKITPIKKSRIFFNNEELKAEQKLSDLNLKNGSQIYFR